MKPVAAESTVHASAAEMFCVAATPKSLNDDARRRLIGRPCMLHSSTPIV
jgi:hypothetical protein